MPPMLAFVNQSPLKTTVSGRLLKTSGFKVNSAMIALCCRAAEPGL
jgi:hypothetical protein